jgi:hypothetical protein
MCDAACRLRPPNWKLVSVALLRRDLKAGVGYGCENRSGNAIIRSAAHFALSRFDHHRLVVALRESRKEAELQRKRRFLRSACFSRTKGAVLILGHGRRTTRIIAIDGNQPIPGRLTCIFMTSSNCDETATGLWTKRRHPSSRTYIGGGFPADRRCATWTWFEARQDIEGRLTVSWRYSESGYRRPRLMRRSALAFLLQRVSSRIGGGDSTASGFDER